MTTANTNPYALPNGQIVTLPAHCRESLEQFTLPDRTVVWAVAVGDGTREGALRIARQLPLPPKP